jgi:hypothetical protein
LRFAAVAERAFEVARPAFALADAEESRTGPDAFAARASGRTAVARLARAGLPARAGAAVPPRAAARRALERWGRVRGRLASTPPSLRPAAVSSLAFESATAHIIA